MDESKEMPAERPIPQEIISLEEEPIYDAGIFTITHVSHSEKGLTIENTDEYDSEGNLVDPHLLRRRDTGSPLPLIPNDPETGEGERANLAKGMQGEMKFAGGLAAKEELDKLRSGEYNSHVYERKRKEYVARMEKSKVRLSQIQQNGDIISIKTRPVSFPLYDEFATRENAKREDLMDFSEATGTAAVIITKDDKAILQYRSKTNSNYGNIPGASAAGLLDGEFDSSRSVKGVLKPLTETSIRKHLTKEATEELQVSEDKLQIRVVGIAHDQIKPHHEFMLLGKVDETSEELAANGLLPDEVEGHDFRERYFTIDATPEAFENLLTQVKCPLPPTHAAVYFMAGLDLARQKHGDDYAKEWGQRVTEGIKNNYAEIDRMVINNYNSLPAQVEEKPVRSQMGYDPKYLPEEQGLPSLLDELIRTELIPESMYWKLKSKYNPEE